MTREQVTQVGPGGVAAGVVEADAGHVTTEELLGRVRPIPSRRLTVGLPDVPMIEHKVADAIAGLANGVLKSPFAA